MQTCGLKTSVQVGKKRKIMFGYAVKLIAVKENFMLIRSMFPRFRKERSRALGLFKMKGPTKNLCQLGPCFLGLGNKQALLWALSK